MILALQAIGAHGDEPAFLHDIASFRTAKKISTRIHADARYSFYCGCSYAYRRDASQRYARNHVEPRDCGYEPARSSERARFIEWEHVVPAYDFGRTRSCWREGHPRCKGRGRKCCRKVDPIFRAMEADLHNLQPAIGELNQDRGHLGFGLIPGEERDYGACDFEVDRHARVVEPRPEVRGDIARTYFYMERMYGVRISRKNRRLFETWDAQDPISPREQRRNRRIMEVQGNSNPFVF